MLAPVGRASILALACLGLAGAAPAGGPAVFPQGIASGDVRSTSAVLWTRATAAGRVRFEWGTSPRFQSARSRVVRTGGDLTSRTRVGGLRPGTRYWYRVSQDGRGLLVGTFRTPPRARARAAVRLVIGGDVGGQRFCRNLTDGGYRIFGAMEDLQPDVFVANGDLVYVDGDCPAGARAEWPNVPGDFPNVIDLDWREARPLREAVLAHWRYNRADPFSRIFFARTPVVAQWDDHEVINDFGARWTYWNAATRDRPGYRNLVAAGREAFFLYSPVAGRRVYRSFRYGRHAELFVLDARSYRSRNDRPDGAGKTMLGRTQLEWLKRGLGRSRATWKIVSSDVPLSIPTGTNAAVFGHDSWVAFEHELRDLLRFLDRRDVRNVVVVVTDVHFAQNIRYDLDVDGDGDRVRVHELVNGPLAAIRLAPVPLDPAFEPTSLYAEGNLFNFGFLRVSRGGRLTYDVRDIDGRARPGSRLLLAPAR
jgi:alkaline phosphatase D